LVLSVHMIVVLDFFAWGGGEKKGILKKEKKKKKRKEKERGRKETAEDSCNRRLSRRAPKL